MKKFLHTVILLSCLFPGPAFSADGDSLLIMFWNLENFFDYRDGGGGDADREFSSGGERHWTGKRFYAKCDAVSKAILWTAAEYGRLPDAIAVAEVENRFVLERLVHSTLLDKLPYGIIHYDSPDHRGIDVALLYRKDVLEHVRSAPCRVFPAGSGYGSTRDILIAEFRCGDGRLAILVNHHPSKYGGERVSAPKRRLAVERLKAAADSLVAAGYTEIVATGDFNDTPDNPAFGILSPPLVNKALPLHCRGEGTIRHQGRWEMIDMFFVTPRMDEYCEMETVRIPFLMTRDAMAGEKPLRTYSGPRYCGGASDHLPIVLKVCRPPE